MITGSLADIAKQINDTNVKIAVLVAYDSDNDTYFVVEGDSTTGKLSVDAS
jgi:hypothetical protein